MNTKITTADHAFDAAALCGTAQDAVNVVWYRLNDATQSRWLGGDSFEPPAHPDVSAAFERVQAARQLLAEASHILAMHGISLDNKA